MTPRIPCLALILAATPAARAQTLLFEQYGAASYDEVGYSVAGGVDFDLDGFDDLVVGASHADTGGLLDNGVVRVIAGADGSVLHTKVGDDDLDLFGWSVAVADDIDGDGHPDFVVGAPGAAYGNLRPGLVRVVSGRTGATLQTVYGSASGDTFGYAVVARLDWNGDGVGDFVGGAPNGDVGPSVDPGYARVFSGASPLVLGTYESTFDHASWGAALASGDVNGDGVRDLVVGAPDAGALERGQVGVIDGLTHAQIHALFGDTPFEHFGSALAVGDADGDGYDDLFVGSPDDDAAGTSTGSVRAIDGLGGSTVHTWFGDTALEYFGASVALIGDVDEDGDSDLVVGAPARNSTAPGTARLISTGTRGELFRVEGGVDGQFGHAVAEAGDFNADGSRDFAVGSPAAEAPSNPGVRVGAARVFSAECPVFVNYCTAGTSAHGCQAQISAVGVPSATASVGFFLGALGAEGNKSGFFFYGANGRQASPWGNGTSFNARWCASCAKPSHNPGAGAMVQAQLWYRDPLNTSNRTTSLSNALEFAMCP